MIRLNKILSLLLVLTCLPMWGQRKEQPPLFDSSHPSNWIEFNVHASVGLSSVMQNYGSELPGLSDFMLSPGCRFGGGIDVRFDINNSFGLATGLDFYTNNFRYAMSLVDNSSGSISSLYTRNHFYTLTVPVYLSWRLNIGRRMMWNIDAGLYFTQGVGGHFKASGYVSGQNSIGQPVVNHAYYETKYYETQQAMVNGVRKFDYGPRVSTGLIYRHHFLINAVLQVGARNLAINQGSLDINYHNLCFDFQVGYIF